MDVKTAFLNGYLEESIYMKQLEGFMLKYQEEKDCKLIKSIYELKQVFISWNLRFDETIKTYRFKKNIDEPCVYKLNNNESVVYFVLYFDDNLFIRNGIGKVSEVKNWLLIAILYTK